MGTALVTGVVILHPGFVRTEMTHGSGNVEVAEAARGLLAREAARGLLARIDVLTLEKTGRFLHANGEELPW